MSEVLVIAEHREGALRDVTLELVSAAREIGGSITVAVIARDPAAHVAAVSVDGVDEVVTVAVDADEFEADVYQAAVEALIGARQPQLTLAGFTVDAMGYAPAVACRLGLGFASDVFGLRAEGGEIVAERSLYSGKVHAEIDFPNKEQVLLLVRPTVYAPAEGAGSPTVTALEASAPSSRARHSAFVEPVSDDDVDITAAPLLLAIGRGVGEESNIETFVSLAQKMGAELASSRPLVDAGWLPASRQVGQSGKTVKPALYLAFGISGAIQHLAGMKTSGTVVAVNTDPEAAIFGVSQFAAVADMFDVAEELEKLY